MTSEISPAAALASAFEEQVRAGESSHYFYDAGESPWEAVRALVAAADDASYAEARAAAAKLRDGAPLFARAMVAYAFPDEPAWAAEDAAQALRPGHPTRIWMAFLLASLREAEPAARILAACSAGGISHAVTFALDLVEGLGVEAEAPLLALADDLSHPWTPAGDVKHGALALAQIQSPTVARFFAAHLDHKQLGAAASDYFARAPHLAVRALVSMASGKKATTASALLAGVVREHPEAAEVASPFLDEPARAAVEALRDVRVVPDADAGELPAVLVSPPWLAKTKRKAPPVIEGLAVPARAESVEAEPASESPPSGEGDARVLRELGDENRFGGKRFLMQLLPLSERAVLEAFARFPREDFYLYGLEETFAKLFSWYGAAMIGPALDFAGSRPAEVVRLLVIADSTRVAPLMARAVSELPSARRDAERWLLRHPETAAVALVPAALGKARRERRAAEISLRFLVARGHEAVVRAAAQSYGAEAASAIDAVLAADPLTQDLPTRPPRMPEFWHAAALPRPLLAGRKKALPLAAVEHLGTMLAFTRHDEPYPGLALVRAACDPASLHDFAWELFEAWMRAGAVPSEKWAFFALGHLGGDEAARKLAPLVRAWPSQQAPGRAMIGLEVLATIGSDIALMLLHGIAQKVKSAPLQKKARALMDSIAAAQGLGADELADRLVPDLGLDEDGSMVLDFGARTFRVGFDEQLRPFVRGEGDKRLAELPKPGKNDDAEKAAAAGEIWKRLKRDARAVAAAQIARLEAALATRRRWDRHPFLACVVQHPLVGHLAKRLVWGVYSEEGRLEASFRVAEDRSLAGRDDTDFTLPEEAKIGLVHPIDLGREATAAWGQVIADYEIVQPFPQIGREIFVPTEEEARALTIDRAVGRQVDGNRLSALDRLGWRRGQAGDGGMIDHYEREIGGFSVVLAFSPGLMLYAAGNQPVVTLGAVNVYPIGRRHLDKPVAVAALDPLLFSEIVRDLSALRS